MKQGQDSDSILLYDGVCGLCNGLVQFLLKRDESDEFRFASLQSEFAIQVLQRHNRDPRDLDTVYLLINYNQPTERVLARSDAIIAALWQLAGFWKLAVVGKLLPRFIRDAVYNVVARYRYQVFGRHETCFLPEARYRHKFL